MKTYDITKDFDEEEQVACPHCSAKNPQSAYCCLKCFKVMIEKKKTSVVTFQVRPSVAIVVIFSALLYSGFSVMKRWVASVEAEMSTNIDNARYQMAQAEDKVRSLKDSRDEDHTDASGLSQKTAQVQYK